MARAAVAALVAGLAAAAVAHGALFPRLPRECSRSDYSSSGVLVRAALCLPSGSAMVPAAIVLHGCGGFDTFDHRLAVELPQAGIATLYVDYFAPTPPPGRKGFCGGGGGDAFAVWQREVVAAAAHLRRQARVEPRRVAVVGWSLGGGLALATSAEHPRLFQARVAFSTGVPPGIRVHAVHGTPPTLLLSGGPGDAIPLAWTQHLYRILRAAGVKVTLYDYGHGVHTWPHAQGSVGVAVAERFLRRALTS
jgi:dienelactone hydrolase